MRSILLILILIHTVACSKNEAEKTNEAVDVALTYLSDGKCEKAIDVLEDAGVQNNDAVYLQVLASAYACKADFNEIEFIDGDLKNITTTSAATIIKDLAGMNYSAETAADSPDFTAILTGLNYLLNSTSGDPGQTERETKFGVRKSGDMGMQVLILSLADLGKFLRFYGNTDAAGAKGAGTGTNNCFMDYNDPRAQALVGGGTTGACVSNNDGHPDLDQSTANGKRRMCEGIVLLTNALDVLENIDFSDSSTLSNMSDVSAQIATYRALATSAGIGNIIDMTSQEECEDYAAVPAQLLDLEYFYALIYEVSLQ